MHRAYDLALRFGCTISDISRYSSTSSAATRSVWGMVNLALSRLGLMAGSNSVGCLMEMSWLCALKDLARYVTNDVSDSRNIDPIGHYPPGRTF
jgi:hypothetical protein